MSGGSRSRRTCYSTQKIVRKPGLSTKNVDKTMDKATRADIYTNVHIADLLREARTMGAVYPSTRQEATSYPAKGYPAKGRKLLDQLRDVLRAKHYSYQTEQYYVHSLTPIHSVPHKRHPRDMRAAEIERFLTHLAVEARVAASTGRQAVCAKRRTIDSFSFDWLSSSSQ